MTQDEIIEMARQAGGIDISKIYGGGVRVWLGTDRTEFFETLIKLAVAKEREECAKLCDSTVEQTYISGYTGAVHATRRECAAAIRARGQA